MFGCDLRIYCIVAIVQWASENQPLRADSDVNFLPSLNLNGTTDKRCLGLQLLLKSSVGVREVELAKATPVSGSDLWTHRLQVKHDMEAKKTSQAQHG